MAVTGFIGGISDTTVQYIDHDFNGANGTVFQFEDKSIGAIGTRRYIAVFLFMTGEEQGPGSELPNALGVTIGGHEASFIARHTSGSNWAVELWGAWVPEGMTADFEFETDIQCEDVAIRLFRLTNVKNGPASPQIVGAASGGAITFDQVTVDDGGCIVACGFTVGTGGTPSWTWTELTPGSTVNWTTGVGGVSFGTTVATKVYETGGTPVITADPTGSLTVRGLAAAFR